jgi:hypothetical protein
MKRTCFVCVFLCLTTAFLLSQSNPVPLVNRTTATAVSPISASQSDPKAHAKILDNYGKLPLAFEANHGQTDGRVKFLSRTGGYSLFLTKDEAVLALRGKTASTNKAKMTRAAHSVQPGMAAPKAGGVLRMKLRNASAAAKVSGMDQLTGTTNYFFGNDPAKWQTSVPTYAKVKYEGIYSGIDLVYYGNQQRLEYDFIVAPGADPHRISFVVRGANRIRRDGNGDLVFKVNEEEIRWHKPVVYQERDGTRQEIAARYAIRDTDRIGFELAKYDTSRQLYIDPLIYSTYLDNGLGTSIAVDSTGNAYVTGSAGPNFPTTRGAFQTTCCGAFVTKFNPAGSALIFSTYIGGSRVSPSWGIAVDSAGDSYITGYTNSTDFPVTPGAFQTTCDNSNICAFVTNLDSTGSALNYSTYLGGNFSDAGFSIAVDGGGNAYVTGSTGSSDFPVTPGAFQTNYGGSGDAFVTKLNPAGSALVYSTYLGGSGEEDGWGDGGGIAVDSAGNAYVTGGTGSTDFPVTPGAFQTNNGGGDDAFVTKLNPAGSALVYSTYLGGSGQDVGEAIAVDSAGNAYVTGGTGSTDFPVTPGAFQTKNAGFGDVFVTKINPAGSALVYSTYLGGSGNDDQEGGRIAVDDSGNAYVTGGTFSTNFPTTPGAIKRVCRNCGGKKGVGGDAFMAKFNAEGSALFYSTYLGGSGADYGYGIAVDSAGNAYVTGDTASTNFPVTPGAFQTTCCGVFVTKINPQASTTTTLTSSPNPSADGETVLFTATLASSAGSPPNGEIVSFIRGTKLLGTGTLSGGTATFTTSTLKVGTSRITAVYGGDSNFVGSTSKPLKQVVENAGK